jgi:hypothetical protein
MNKTYHAFAASRNISNMQTTLSPTGNPCILAYEGLAQIIHPPLPVEFTTGKVTKLSKLRELWAIDDEAYQDCSLPFPRFQSWWQRYPLGNTVISTDDQIVASIGIWPLDKDQFEAFTEGKIPEADLNPVPLSRCEGTAQPLWYISGIVIRNEYRLQIGAEPGRNPLTRLLRAGIRRWLESGHVAYPLQVAALAEYVKGEELLTLFGFKAVKEGAEMPDGCHLYALTIASEEEAQVLTRSLLGGYKLH